MYFGIWVYGRNGEGFGGDSDGCEMNDGAKDGYSRGDGIKGGCRWP